MNLNAVLPTNKTPDEIEKAIVAALVKAGQTTCRRDWWTPTGIAVHGFKWSAQAANAVGQPQVAGVFALLYGLVDIFGFSGTVKLAFEARASMQKKEAPSNAKDRAQNS
jgi:hypothetical protein